MRRITVDDFKNTRTIKAQYRGKNQYLSNGEWYNIRFMEKRRRVSIPLCDNPQIEKSNGGMEFGLKNFYIEE